MNRITMAVFLLVATTCMMAALTPAAEAAPPRRPYLVDLDDPDSVLDVLSRLERSLMRSNDFEHPKRGVDFGLGRGYSGSQAAKHLMGLAAANYAIGPGRKRRDAVEAPAQRQSLPATLSQSVSSENSN